MNMDFQEHTKAGTKHERKLNHMRSVVPFGWQAAFCAARTRAYDPLVTLADL